VSRRRHWFVVALVVLATIFGYISILALWANRQFLNTDNWTTTSSQLLQKKSVRDQISTFLVDQLYANVNVQAQLAQALPPQAKPLAGPAAGALRNALEQGVDKLLERPKVQQLWEDANRVAHSKFLQVIEGGTQNVNTEGGNVTLNLGTIVRNIGSQVGLGGLTSNIPPDAAQITILKSKQLDTVQNALKALRGITIVVLVLTLVLFVIAVAISRDRKRETLRMVGGAFIIAGLLALITRYLVGNAVVDSLATTASIRPAVRDTWSVASSLLIEAAQSSIAYGVVIVLAAWLAGPTRWATGARRGLAPALADWRLAFGGILVIVLILVLWGPTPATRNPLGLLLFAVLLGVGMEYLRRETRRENPDATWGAMGKAAGERVSGISSKVTAGGRAVAGRVGAVNLGGGKASGEGTKLEQLERLGRLKESGVLNEQEFEQQKASILAESSG
jgi:hypothetical protein